MSCIDVTIMDRFAYRALPPSYSKTFPAFRAGTAVAHAAGLGGKRFIDFLEPYACVSAFIRQHGSKRTPPRIGHRLGLLGLCERGGIDVTDEDCTVGLDQSGAQFVQEILAPICDLGVNRSGSVSMPGALRARYTDIQIPASTAVFTKITRAQLEFTQTVAIPQRQPTSREVDMSPLDSGSFALYTGSSPRSGARQARKPCGVLVFHAQMQHTNGTGSRTGHMYSIAPQARENTRETTAKNPKCAMRGPLSLSGPKAGVSRGRV